MVGRIVVVVVVYSSAHFSSACRTAFYCFCFCAFSSVAAVEVGGGRRGIRGLEEAELEPGTESGAGAEAGGARLA